MAQDLDPAREVELVHLAVLEGYKVPDRELNTLFDSVGSRREDTAGYSDLGTRSGTDGDSLPGLGDCQDD